MGPWAKGEGEDKARPLQAGLWSEELILKLHWEGARALIPPGGPPVDQLGFWNREGDIDWGGLSPEPNYCDHFSFLILIFYFVFVFLNYMHLFKVQRQPGFTVSDPPQPQEQTWPQVNRKGGKGKKNTTAAPVAASSKNSVPKGPPPLPPAQRRFIASWTSATHLNDSFITTATLPDMMAAGLKVANCSLPLSLTASVNRNGAVTLTANSYTSSSAYSPFFDAMTKKLNQSSHVVDNLFQVFREAPTSVELLIHNLPLSILPHEPTDLFPSLLESISNAIDLPICAARFLQ